MEFGKKFYQVGTRTKKAIKDIFWAEDQQQMTLSMIPSWGHTGGSHPKDKWVSDC